MIALRRTRQLHWLIALLPLLMAAGCALLLSARPALAAPRAAAVQQTMPPTLPVTMTVGTASSVCASTTSVTVKRGDPVFICYVLQNISPISNTNSVTFTNQVVYESDAGTGANSRSEPFAQAIPPATKSQPLLMPAFVPQASGGRTGRVAANLGSGPQQVQGESSVTITIINPALTVRQTLSTSSGECSDDSAITVPAIAAVYRCLTLTNTGDVPLAPITLTVGLNGGAGAVYTMAEPLIKDKPRQLTHGAADATLKPALSFAIVGGANTTSVVTAQAAASGEPMLRSETASSSATANVGTATTTLTAAPNDKEACATNASISTVTNTSIYYCLRLNNTGNTTLTRHLIGRTGQAPVTLDRPLAPAVTLVITSGTLSALGLPPILGPQVVTANVNTTFVVTSTAQGGFRSVAAAPAVSVLASTPTSTPTSTWTPIPTATPWPTWTPWPVTPTWTPLPTWTPTDMPPLPTPTWTRSFELSNLQTPTPRADSPAGAADPAAVDFQATALAQNDPNAYLTPDFAANPPFDSDLPTPVIDANNPEQPGDIAPVVDTETPTETPTIEPTRTPLPTQMPTPTATPTATQRPIVYAAPAPPPSFGSLFAGVLDSTMAATGILFVTTGAVVFFGVLATVLALAFLRNSRRPFDLQETGEDDPNFTPSRGDGQRGPASGASGDRWPTSLP